MTFDELQRGEMRGKVIDEQVMLVYRWLKAGGDVDPLTDRQMFAWIRENTADIIRVMEANFKAEARAAAQEPQ